MTVKTVLRGITWNHSRGFVSVVATAQRFCELHPNVEITWEKALLARICQCADTRPCRSL